MGFPWKPPKPAAMIFWRSWGHDRGRDGDDRDRPRRGIRTKFLERLDPAHAGQLNVHEDQGGTSLAGQRWKSLYPTKLNFILTKLTLETRPSFSYTAEVIQHLNSISLHAVVPLLIYAGIARDSDPRNRTLQPCTSGVTQQPLTSPGRVLTGLPRGWSLSIHTWSLSMSR